MKPRSSSPRSTAAQTMWTSGWCECTSSIPEGAATMRVNNALDPDEISDGWVLTCQGEPLTAHVTVVYED